VERGTSSSVPSVSAHASARSAGIRTAKLLPQRSRVCARCGPPVYIRRLYMRRRPGSTGGPSFVCLRPRGGRRCAVRLRARRQVDPPRDVRRTCAANAGCGVPPVCRRRAALSTRRGRDRDVGPKPPHLETPVRIELAKAVERRHGQRMNRGTVGECSLRQREVGDRVSVLRAQGLRPIQILVPDTRSPMFAAEAARASRSSSHRARTLPRTRRSSTRSRAGSTGEAGGGLDRCRR
jgi:Antitoxin MazE-like